MKFEKGHKFSTGKKRTLQQQIDDDSKPAMAKRKLLARHFGIDEVGWAKIKEAARKNPQLVTAWDLGFRPSKSPDKVILTNGKNASKYDLFCLKLFENPTMPISDLADEINIPVTLASLWALDVQNSDKYKDIQSQQSSEIEKSFEHLVTEGIRMLGKSKDTMDINEYLNNLTKLSSLYRNIQSGKQAGEKTKQIKSVTKPVNEKGAELPKIEIDFGDGVDDDFEQGE